MEVALNSGLADSGQLRLLAAHAVHALDPHKDSTAKAKASPTRLGHAGLSGSDLDLNGGQARARTPQGNVVSQPLNRTQK